MKIVLIIVGVITGALFVMFLLAGIAVAGAGECMKEME